MARLGDLTNIKTGKLDANAASPDGQYPFFTCSKETLRIATYQYDCECVLVAGNGDLNVKYYCGKFDAYQRTYIIESKDNSVLLVPYMYYFLDGYVETLRGQSIGGVIKYIKLGNLTEAQIPLPDLCVQSRIVDRMKRLEQLISLHKQQLAKLGELVKARFVEMFGRPGTVCSQWPLELLGNCCILNPSKNRDPNLIPGLAVSFVPMSAVSEDGDIDVSETRTYDEVKTGFTYFAENDVLFAKITPCMENGKGAVAQRLQNGIGFGSTEFHVLRPIDGKSDPYWLYTITSFKQFRMDAQANMTGSAGQRRVPASYLEAYKIACPPFEQQGQFASFCKQMKKQKLTIQQSLDKLEVLKKSLMQEYFG